MEGGRKGIRGCTGGAFITVDVAFITVDVMCMFFVLACVSGHIGLT